MFRLLYYQSKETIKIKKIIILPMYDGGWAAELIKSLQKCNVLFSLSCLCERLEQTAASA